MLKEYDRCRARHLDSEPLEKPAVGQPEGAVAVKVKANTCLLFGASDALFGLGFGCCGVSLTEGAVLPSDRRCWHCPTP